MIGDDTTLLDYGDQFMGSLHVVDSRSRTRRLVVIYIWYWSTVILFVRMLNQLQTWILREPVLLWVLVVPTLSSYTMMAWFMRVRLALGSFLFIKAFMLDRE